VTLTTALKSRQTLLHMAFVCLCLLVAAVCWRGLQTWMVASKSSEQSSDFWTIPLISLYLCYERRAVIFAKTHFAPVGFALLAAGVGIYAASLVTPLALGPDFVIPVLLEVIVSIAGALSPATGRMRCAPPSSRSAAALASGCISQCFGVSNITVKCCG
jgi:hypothetical protein